MIKKLREEFEKGLKTKKDMGMDLFYAEKGLFDYQWILSDNPCSSLTITRNGVHADFDVYGQNIKMYLDEHDYSAVPAQILSKGFYEKNELDMVLKLVDFMDSDAVVFDVGANLGWYGINIMKQRPKTKVYFFEPVPDTVVRLKNNLKLNDIDDNSVNCFGLLNENTVKQFYYDVSESGASSLADLREKETTRYIDVHFKRMDDFIKDNKIDRLDFIKCDVEGSELFVYQGGIEAIKKFKPIVFSEMLRKWAKKFSYHPNDIITLFKDCGYACFVIDNGYLKEFETVTEETIETNYCFLHKEKHANIISGLRRN